MANVLFAARTAAATTLNAVTGAAVALNAGVTALSELANVASDHATEFRKQQQAVIRDTSDYRTIAGTQESRIAIAERLQSIQDRLDANPKLEAMYQKVGAELAELRKPKAVA